MEKLYAPFIEEQIINITEWQRNDYTHEMTCIECGDLLQPQPEGMECDCGFSQNWVPVFVARFDGITGIDLPVEEEEDGES
jgi:hypothetical protein